MPFSEQLHFLPAGPFVLFMFCGLSMLVLQLIFSIIAVVAENVRRNRKQMERMARRLCYVESSKPVTAPRIEHGCGR